MVTGEIRRLGRLVSQRLSPKLVGQVDTWRTNRRTARAAVVAQELGRRFDWTTQSGPFRGMRYIAEARNSGLCPKLVGCYESEIAPVFEEAVKRPYDLFVDVGCAEGYYAVGVARATGRRTRVVAYDIEAHCRDLCRQLADLNGVGDGVEIRATCDHAELQGLCAAASLPPSARVLVLADCEGFEAELIDPQKVPALRGVDVLVELHEFAAPGVAAVIARRFEPTHEVKLIDSVHRKEPRPEHNVDFLRSPADRRIAVDDRRATPQQWAWLRARAGA